jgi:hypothetical protein
VKILLGVFNEKLGREDIFKPTMGNESLPEGSNDNGVTAEIFATFKNLVVKCIVFSHGNIHKQTWTSPDGKTHKHVDHVLIDTSYGPRLSNRGGHRKLIYAAAGRKS